MDQDSFDFRFEWYLLIIDGKLWWKHRFLIAESSKKQCWPLFSGNINQRPHFRALRFVIYGKLDINRILNYELRELLKSNAVIANEWRVNIYKFLSSLYLTTTWKESDTPHCRCRSCWSRYPGCGCCHCLGPSRWSRMYLFPSRSPARTG